MRRIEIAFLFGLLILAFIFGMVSLFSDTAGINGHIVIVVLSAAGIALLIETLIRSRDKFPKLFKLLYDYCSPDSFLMEARVMLEKEQERKRPKHRYRLLYLMIIGQYAAGRFQEAMEMLQSVDIVPHPKNAGLIAYYYHQRFLIALEIGRQDIAWGSLVVIREIIGAMPARAARRLKQIYERDMHLLNIARGNCDNAKEMFLDEYLKAQTKYERVCAAYTLGVISRHLGNEEDAREAFEYVVENGNKLHIAGLAAEQLGLK